MNQADCATFAEARERIFVANLKGMFLSSKSVIPVRRVQRSGRPCK